MKIAIYAIARNEAAHVARFMAAAAAADYVLVADTGSADDTVAQLRAAGADVRCIAVVPWRFDVARNSALDLLPPDIDVCIALDLDEVLQPGWRAALEAAWVPGVTRLRYDFVWSHHADGSPAVRFWADKIHARHGYRWQHPVHELLAPDCVEQYATADLRIDHYPDPGKPRSSYLPLLELAVAERPDSAQHAFWLGREYLAHGRWEQAIAALTRYLGLPGATWPPERAAAMRCLARTALALGRAEEALRWLEQSCAAAPAEREPWVDLAQVHYAAGNWVGGYDAARRALALGERPAHYLTEDDAWGERADDIASICAWQLGQYDAAQAHVARAARLAPDDRRIAANVQWMRCSPAPPGCLPRQSQPAPGPPGPRISAALIVKNEEQTLAGCLDSIAGCVDEIVVVDTGSTDGTREVARRYTDRIFTFAWRQDFAAARQFAFDQATGDWVLWLDADDVVINADKIRAHVANAGPEVACFWWKYVYSRDDYGNPTCECWRERCVRNNQSFRWVGRIHEYLAAQHVHVAIRDEEVVVVHQRPPERAVGNACRNLAILLDEYEQVKDNPPPRLLLYLGNESAGLGELDQGIAFFEQYLRRSTWDDERYIAQVRIASLHRRQSRFAQAIDADLQALKIHPHWPHAYFGLAETYYFLQDWPKVIHWIQVGRQLPVPDTPCIVNPMDLRYAWMIHYTNALYHSGSIAEAHTWTQRALALCPADPYHRQNLAFFAHVLQEHQAKDAPRDTDHRPKPADQVPRPIHALATRPLFEPLRVVWEGPQLVHSSLGLVNRELCAALLRAGAWTGTEQCGPTALPLEQRLELSIEPLPPAEFSPAEEPGHLQALAERFGAPLSGPPDIHVCLSYPPRVTPTPARRRVIYQPWEYTSLPRAWFDLFQHQADEVWVPSVYVRRSYVESGIRPDKVHVIPHGVRPAIFHPAVTPLPLATTKRFKFLFVGGTLWRKGIDVLLDAYTRSFRRWDDVCLVIKDIGVTSYYRGHTAGEQIRHLQQDPDAPEILYMTEGVSDKEIARIYTACDCLVHPYRGEGFALPVAEAMACALPVIVTRGGACDDYCGDDHAYWLPARLTPITIGIEMMAPACVLEPDRDALIAQLQHVFTHRDEGRQKGRTASQHILSHFTWEQAARAVLRRLACLCG